MKQPALPKRDQATIAAHEAGMHDRKPRPDTCTLCAKDEQEPAIVLTPEPSGRMAAGPRKPRAPKIEKRVGEDFIRVDGEPVIDPLAGPPVQGTRMLKCQCPECGYTVRTTRKWIDVATPVCPVDGAEMPAEEK